MKRVNRTLVFGWFTYAIAWFVPVHEHGSSLRDGWLPGWQAAVGCFFGDLGIFGIVSSATNFIMLWTVVWVVFATRRGLAIGAASCAAAAVLNAVWIILFLSDGGGLRAGYYLWSVSFAIVAFGLWRAMQRERGSEGVPASATAVLPIS